ncbi:hypothetical protein SRIMM317S_02137 [Streptomyces rimosus subsp. rimosus]
MTGSTSVARQASDRSLVAGGAYRMVRISATGLAARKDDHRRRGCRENRRMAAREVPAIHALGGGFARSFGARCEKAPGGRGGTDRGIDVDAGTRQGAVDRAVVVEYGMSIR